ncbi:MAG: dinitrogenase iron-molybdenum cofactor [Thermoprotei archaeon]|nr:MAG: dinitrogenase iron-molybdenum cofactor [Thermoprotei archaeon]
MRKLRVAFGMDNEEMLSSNHFGDSAFYSIYDIYEDGSYVFVEQRENLAKNVAEERHGDPRKFKAVVELLKDVDVLTAFRMGPNYLRIRDNSGKVPFITGTKKLSEALSRVAANFNRLWEEKQKKLKK